MKNANSGLIERLFYFLFPAFCSSGRRVYRPRMLWEKSATIRIKLIMKKKKAKRILYSYLSLWGIKDILGIGQIHVLDLWDQYAPLVGTRRNLFLLLMCLALCCINITWICPHFKGTISPFLSIEFILFSFC